ncbi:ubiquitin carboxyl-terminal hydrolase, family 1 [Seiridium cupressi]
MGAVDMDAVIVNGHVKTPEADDKSSQNSSRAPEHKTEDPDGGVGINGNSSNLYEPHSPPRDEDEVMKDASDESKVELPPPKLLAQMAETAPRRSTRSRKAPANYEDEYVIPAATDSAKPTAASSRPKRKAAAAAQKTFTSKEDLDLVTETICAPMVSEELRSYKGWVELESEPSFFQAMLHEIGAPDLKITELFSTDAESIDALPKPVYGLIFLFPYEDFGEQNPEERHDCPEELWFANQTTANGCATVALMNITMNIPNSTYGPELQQFKRQTAPLSYLDRGHALDTNDFIRCIHNSVARRTQLLNEDLAWRNKVEEEEREQRKNKRPIRAARGKGKTKIRVSTATNRTVTRRKKDYSNTANHYIAYVPHDGKVWEFDGLEDKPLCLGEYQGDSDNWAMTAIETIKVRMAAGVFSNTFNLLAVCATPLQTLEDRLVQSLAAAQKLEEEYRAGGESDDPSWPHPPISTLFPPEKLESLNHLTWDMAANIGPTEDFLNKISQPTFNKEGATLLMAELIVEQNDLEAELAAEIDSHQSAQLEYESRQRDFTPFIHQFLLALAEAGQLEETVNNFVET